MAHNPLPDAPHGDLGPLLAEVARRARASWPRLRVLPSALFADHVRQCGAGRDQIVRHGHDLYLACACLQRDPAALSIFEQPLLATVRRRLVRMNIGTAQIDDVLQTVRLQVLGEARPSILGYSGRGPLLGWLRTVGVHAALAMMPGRADTSASGDSLLSGLVAASGDPELGATRLRDGGALQRALDDSLGRLSSRDKTVLRMHYADGLNIDAIGAIYHVHRATVARWLIAIRGEVLAHLRAHSGLAPNLSPSAFHSLALALHDQLHISVDRVLGSRFGP